MQYPVPYLFMHFFVLVFFCFGFDCANHFCFGSAYLLKMAFPEMAFPETAFPEKIKRRKTFTPKRLVPLYLYPVPFTEKYRKGLRKDYRKVFPYEKTTDKSRCTPYKGYEKSLPVPRKDTG